jgi:hypothetical protein
LQAACATSIARAAPGRVLQLGVGHLGPVKIPLQDPHAVSGAFGVAFDPSRRRMEGADQRLAEDRLNILERGVAHEVEKFGHAGLAQLDQGRLRRMRPHVLERRGLDVERGVGGREGMKREGHRRTP